MWLDAGALGGPAFEQGDLRVGGYAAVGVRIPTLPLFARVSFAREVLANGPEGLSAQFTTAGLGAGALLHWTAARIAFEPRIAIVVEPLSVRITESNPDRTDGGDQVGVGAQAGLTGVWERGWISPTLGATAGWHGKATDILQRNRIIATIPAADFSGELGIRFFL